MSTLKADALSLITAPSFSSISTCRMLTRLTTRAHRILIDRLLQAKPTLRQQTKHVFLPQKCHTLTKTMVIAQVIQKLTRFEELYPRRRQTPPHRARVHQARLTQEARARVCHRHKRRLWTRKKGSVTSVASWRFLKRAGSSFAPREGVSSP